MSIDKIRDEMAAASGNPGVARIGEYLTEYVRRHPGAAGAICAEGKSIAGALAALEAYAKKQPRHGSCVMVDDETAFGIVMGYYGIGKGEGRVGAASGDEFDIDALMDI